MLEKKQILARRRWPVKVQLITHLGVAFQGVQAFGSEDIPDFGVFVSRRRRQVIAVV